MVEENHLAPKLGLTFFLLQLPSWHLLLFLPLKRDGGCSWSWAARAHRRTRWIYAHQSKCVACSKVNPAMLMRWWASLPLFPPAKPDGRLLLVGTVWLLPRYDHDNAPNDWRRSYLWPEPELTGKQPKVRILVWGGGGGAYSHNHNNPNAVEVDLSCIEVRLEFWHWPCKLSYWIKIQTIVFVT